MKKQHTPGPWAVSHGYDGSMSVDTVNHVRLNLTTACKVVVADICKHEMAEHFSAEANARLMAAAPDLLSALDDLARYADTCELFLRETHPGKADMLRKRVTAAIDAIAKATGDAA